MSLCHSVEEKGMSFCLQLDIDAAAVEDVADEPADEDVEQGEDERLQLGHREEPACEGDDEAVDADMAKCDGEESAEHEEGERVDAKDEEEFSQWRVESGEWRAGEQGEAQGSEAAREEGVAGRPDDFVEWQPELQQVAEQGEDGADGVQGSPGLCPRGGCGCFVLGGGEAVDERFPAVEADEGVGDGGDGAEQSFGVDGVAVVEVSVAEELEVYATYDVLVDVGHVAVASEEDDGVADEQDDDGGQGVLVLDADGEESGGEVAEGYALQHAEVAQGGEVPLGAVPPLAIPSHGHADEVEQQGAADNLPHGLAVPRKVVLAQGDVGGDAHDEEEEGEDEVGGCHAVPLGVFEDGERVFESVVDEDHGCDGHSAQQVDGDYSFV